MKRLLILLLPLLLSSCMVVKHEFRDVHGNVDKGSAIAFFTVTKASKVNTRTKFKDYLHSSGASGLDLSGDSALFEAMFKAAFEAGKSSQGVP